MMKTRNTDRAEGYKASLMSDEDTISSPLYTGQTPDTALQTLQTLTKQIMKMQHETMLREQA